MTDPNVEVEPIIIPAQAAPVEGEPNVDQLG